MTTDDGWMEIRPDLKSSVAIRPDVRISVARAGGSGTFRAKMLLSARVVEENLTMPGAGETVRVRVLLGRGVQSHQMLVQAREDGPFVLTALRNRSGLRPTVYRLTLPVVEHWPRNVYPETGLKFQTRSDFAIAVDLPQAFWFRKQRAA